MLTTHAELLRAKLKLAEAEAALLAEVNAQMSAVAKGFLKPGNPYAGKPRTPVEEVMHLQVACRMLAHQLLVERGYASPGPADVEQAFLAALTEAQKAAPIQYATPPKESADA